MKNEVIIVGGGMVGAAMAIKLAQQGARVNIVEQHPIDADAVLSDPEIDIRVSAINRFSEQLFSQLGAWPIIQSHRHAVYRRLAAFESAAHTLTFSADEINQSHLGHIIENKVIQAALWSQFSQYDITVHSDLGELISLNTADERVTLTFSNTSLSADLVIGADGAQSKTRTLAGIGVTGWQYQQHCMGILIKLDAEQQDITWQQFQSTGPVAFLPLQAPYANLIWYHQGETLDKLKQLTPAQLKQEILAVYPTLAGEFEVLRHAVFPLTRQHANQYFADRVVLIGDSAHAINPLAGQGVNLGFKDVVELAKCLHNQSDLGAVAGLAQYQQQRKRANLLMMSAMDACYLGFSNQAKGLSWIRQRMLGLANRSGPIKKQVLKYAMGETETMS
ncbi:2-octaprenyl-3-methyl-6-methoxy-1,4-benzoquinol hydroxylase [Pseudoalteromonas ulvae UL12]|nr:FAD-dependent monooxygenase [Pseudoalteromonas ulvae]MBE0362498.1 2-octaprenyl-3-methyl-6-methoxy-1,4-benzoquinol hydroxylase [Pseudoalteromonas ulvae UL12]